MEKDQNINISDSILKNAFDIELFVNSALSTTSLVAITFIIIELFACNWIKVIILALGLEWASTFVKTIGKILSSSLLSKAAKIRELEKK